jgi:hypothetical protein
VEILASTTVPAISSLGYIYLGTALAVLGAILINTLTFISSASHIDKFFLTNLRKAKTISVAIPWQFGRPTGR